MRTFSIAYAHVPHNGLNYRTAILNGLRDEELFGNCGRLLNDVKYACAGFPDKRKGVGDYTMVDIGRSAFSLFFMQSEWFLSYPRSARRLQDIQLPDAVRDDEDSDRQSYRIQSTSTGPA